MDGGRGHPGVAAMMDRSEDFLNSGLGKLQESRNFRERRRKSPLKITRIDFLSNQMDGTEPDRKALRNILNVICVEL